MKTVFSLAIKIVTTIFFGITMLLFTLGLSTTAYGSQFSKDSISKNIVVLLILAGLILLFQRKLSPWLQQKNIRITNKITNSRVTLSDGSGFWLMLCLYILFLVAAQLNLTSSDGGKCLKIASEIQELNFSAFVPGGYLNRYPHQTGLVLYYYFLSFIFGKSNFLIIQFLNASFCSLAINRLNKIVVI